MSTTSGEHGAYSSSHKLEGQAASAALYATRDTPSSKSSSHPLLDEDGKLSSAGAATSLKYARAQDLPSFPSQGGVKMSSAGAAASLAESNQKSFEYWKPGSIPAANKAAMLAKDYEMDPLWQPETSKSSNSAAGQAMNMKMPAAITSRDSGVDAHRKALMAATGAMSAGRRRAGSAPIAPQDDGGWALKAATSSQKSNLSPRPFTKGDPGFEASRLQNMAKGNVNRAMYGSAPPVAIEVEEKNRNAMLRASAVAMAQKMYAVQQNIIEEAKKGKDGTGQTGARSAHRRALSDASDALSEEEAPPNQYLGLEEQARKLAQARLAKIHDEHAEYRSYYGQNNPPKSRMSLRGRRRASSDGQFLSDDEEAARRITTQMSIFTSKLAEVDSKKRQSDRDNLMAAAHRNVTARMNTMDEKVFQETGKQSPHQKELWEAEARKKAQADSDDRMLNHGKIHIGGGKYLDQSDVEAIARARLQPTLDDISDKAEKQRARDEEIRLEQEKIKRDAEIEKTRQAEIKAEQKRVADQEKAEERARKAEEKRVQKEAETAAKEKARGEAAAQKEIANAEKERLRQEAAVKKQAENTERERLRADATAEKARLTARKEAEKEEKRKSKDPKSGLLAGVLGGGAVGATAAGGAATAMEGETLKPATATGIPDGPEPEGDTVHDQVTVEQPVEDDPFVDSKEDEVAEGDNTLAALVPTEDTVTAPGPTTASQDVVETPASPPKSDSKVKSWFKTRFRAGSKTQKEEETSGFVGGAALTGTGIAETEEPKSDSERNVALAGRSTTNESDDMYGNAEPATTAAAAPEATPTARSPSISSLSESDYDEPSREAGAEGSVTSDPPRGRRGFKERFLNKMNPKEPISGVATDKPVMVTKVSSGEEGPEEFEEARDTFEEEKLAPPPKLNDIVTDDAPGPALKAVSPTPGSRDRSKFTEEL